ncbi:MAG: putative O-glycosylation ligase, exosortase A system-associated [Hydrogenophaga sp.]|uniref:putative O-glycosylation ligase, exosortase A system-associated n=1 Tax=Hydrogenophaga sp. TaxID=1904254 RepID=UPI002ABB21C4|nr:putative O-glycosylation ligase, exosortase A system-associated [Hydrogenophaga sp.]MDZ4104135.1 putative O-glycosylation ligase, exosortase A system-associated [Hydrogenophaga sp.]
MRDLVMFFIVLGWVPMAFMNGFVAFLLWIYTSMLSPQFFLYGFMSGFRYVFVFAGITLGLMVLGRVKDRGQFIWDKIGVILVIFIAHALISALLSINSNPAVSFRLENFIKGMALALVTPFFLTTRERIHATLIVVVAGLGFHGVVEGAKVISSGGAHNITGIGGATLGDNNLLALGMVMLLPLTLYLAKYSKSQSAKWSSLGVFVLCVMTVLGSNSRGGFLALFILGVWYWITSPRKLVSAVLVAVVTVGIVNFAPERWFDRIATIKDAGEDQSFLGRVAAWKVSVNIANDNPIFGAGFDAVQVASIWDQYKQKPNFINIEVPSDIAFKAAHSNYFQVMADCGYVGLFLFLALLTAAFISRWQIKGLVKRLPGDHAWASDLSTAITLSLVAFMVGGAGVSLAYFELAYLLIVMISIVLHLLEKKVAATKSAVAMQPGKLVKHA